MHKIGFTGVFYKCFVAVIFSAILIGGAAAKEIDSTSFYNNFKDIKFKDQNNRPFSTNVLENKLVLINFIYTECASVCLTQTQDLAKVYKDLDTSVRKDLNFVSVSLDPAKDNPKSLKRFTQRMKAEIEGWYFLASNFHGVQLLTSRLTLFRKEPKVYIADPVAQAEQRKKEELINKSKLNKLEEHATTLWLIDKSGHIIQTYVGTPVDVTRLEKEIKELHRLQFSNPL